MRHSGPRPAIPAELQAVLERLRERRELRTEARAGRARRAQCAGEPDERQSDERGGVARFHRFEQGGAESLAAESAGTIERAVELDVTRDLVRGQRAESHRGAVDVLVAGARSLAQQDRRRVELDDAPALGRQLRAAARGVAGLAEDAALEVGDLVRADDPAPGVTRGDGLRLGPRQAQRPGAPATRRLAGDSSTPGATVSKARPRRREEVRPVGRSRSQDEGDGPWHSGLKKQ